MNYNAYAVISGALIGAGALLLKLFLGTFQVHTAAASLLLGLLGGLMLQYSLKHQKMHLVASLSSGSSSVVSAAGGILFLNEALSFQELLGVAFIVAGILLLLYRANGIK